MKLRIAKKIVGGCGVRMGDSKWGARRYDQARRIMARRKSRAMGVPFATPRSRGALAVLGGTYFTIGKDFLYLVDVETRRTLLPICKTQTQRRAVLAEIARLGGKIDGERMIVDGDDFIATMPRENKGMPVALIVDFRARGSFFAHATINLHP